MLVMMTISNIVAFQLIPPSVLIKKACLFVVFLKLLVCFIFVLETYNIYFQSYGPFRRKGRIQSLPFPRKGEQTEQSRESWSISDRTCYKQSEI